MISLGYDAAENLLDIEYPSGDVYRYFHVPAWEYENFMKAESKGTHLNHAFKKAGYVYRKLSRGSLVQSSTKVFFRSRVAAR